MELQVGEYYWIKTYSRNLEIAVYDGRFYVLETSYYFNVKDVEVVEHIERPKV